MNTPILTHGGRLRWTEQVLRDEALPGSTARVVAAGLASFHNSQTGQTNPSVITLAKRCGLKETATRTGLALLAKAGHIRVHRTEGGTNSYELVLREAVETAERVTPVAPSAGEGRPLVKRASTPSFNGPKPFYSNLSKNPPAGQAKGHDRLDVGERVAVMRVMNRFSSYGEREPLFSAIREVGMSPAVWGSMALEGQILAVLRAGALRL